MLLTLRRVGLLFPGKDFFANCLVFRQPLKKGLPAPLYLAGRSQERFANRQPLYRLWRMPCRTAHYRKQLWKTGAYGIV